MKNAIYIDIDTERERPVTISKPDTITQPETPEQTAVMLNNDVICITEALCSLIYMGHANKYLKKEEVIPSVIATLEGLLVMEDSTTSKSASEPTGPEIKQI